MRETERFKVFSVIFPADMNVFGGRANSIKSYLSLSMDLMGDEVEKHEIGKLGSCGQNRETLA